MRMLSEQERGRRADQRRASLEQLLYTRAQSAYVLGNCSVATIRRLESEGALKIIRLSKSPTATVFHRAANVHALAEGE